MTQDSIRSTSIVLTLEIAMVDELKCRSTAVRKPRRVTITIPHATDLELERRSCEQGRSLSNLSADLLECAVSATLAPQPLPMAEASRAMTAGLRDR
jgi:hypothetical protein